MDTPTESELWTLAQHRSQSSANLLVRLNTATSPPESKLNDLRRVLHDLRAATCAAQEIECRLRNGRAGI